MVVLVSSDLFLQCPFMLASFPDHVCRNWLLNALVKDGVFVGFLKVLFMMNQLWTDEVHTLMKDTRSRVVTRKRSHRYRGNN